MCHYESNRTHQRPHGKQQTGEWKPRKREHDAANAGTAPPWRARTMTTLAPATPRWRATRRTSTAQSHASNPTRDETHAGARDHQRGPSNKRHSSKSRGIAKLAHSKGKSAEQDHTAKPLCATATARPRHRSRTSTHVIQLRKRAQQGEARWQSWTRRKQRDRSRQRASRNHSPPRMIQRLPRIPAIGRGKSASR
jgi:hypothetical protein